MIGLGSEYLFFVGPVVVGSLYFDYYTSQRLQADVKASDLALARAIAEETNTIVDSALQAIRQLATYRAVIESDPEGMEVIFRTILNVRPDVNLVYRLDERGRNPGNGRDPQTLQTSHPQKPGAGV